MEAVHSTSFNLSERVDNRHAIRLNGKWPPIYQAKRKAKGVRLLNRKGRAGDTCSPHQAQCQEECLTTTSTCISYSDGISGAYMQSRKQRRRIFHRDNSRKISPIWTYRPYITRKFCAPEYSSTSVFHSSLVPQSPRMGRFSDQVTHTGCHDTFRPLRYTLRDEAFRSRQTTFLDLGSVEAGPKQTFQGGGQPLIEQPAMTSPSIIMMWRRDRAIVTPQGLKLLLQLAELPHLFDRGLQRAHKELGIWLI